MNFNISLLTIGNILLNLFDIYKQIKACVLYIHPTTKALSLSNLPHLVNYKGVPVIGQFGQLTLGQIVEEAEVIKTGTQAVIIKLQDDVKGTCGVSFDFIDLSISAVH